MVSNEVKKLEQENIILKEALEEFKKKLNGTQKPKSCKYCRHYVQHYMKGGYPYKSEYVEVYAGHCVSGVPIKDGGKRTPKPDECCPYFELGVHEMRLC